MTTLTELEALSALARDVLIHNEHGWWQDGNRRLFDDLTIERLYQAGLVRYEASDGYPRAVAKITTAGKIAKLKGVAEVEKLLGF